MVQYDNTTCSCQKNTLCTVMEYVTLGLTMTEYTCRVGTSLSLVIYGISKVVRYNTKNNSENNSKQVVVVTGLLRVHSMHGQVRPN